MNTTQQNRTDHEAEILVSLARKGVHPTDMEAALQYELGRIASEQNNRQPRFQIGQQYKTLGKFSRLCTIIDILRTFNSSNELVQIRYVATHEFMGQTVTESDVVETTIARGRMYL